MTELDPAEPTSTQTRSDLPVPPDRLRALADRLAEVDLWADVARIRVALLDQDDSSPDTQVDAAWAAFRAGQFDDTLAALSGLPADLLLVMVLTRAANAANGNLGDHHRLMASIADTNENDQIVLRVALISAIANHDLRSATVIARRLLSVLPDDGDAWVVIGADKAVHANWAEAVAAVQKARADRFNCQDDPAEQTLDLLDRCGETNAASALAAHGAVREPGTRPGWTGWPGLLTNRHPRTIGLSDAPYAAAAGFVTSAGTVAVLTGHPEALLLDAGFAALFLAVVRSRSVANLPAPVGRAVRAAHGRRTRNGPSLLARARHRFDLFNEPTPTVQDPNVCVCWQVTCLSGPAVASYLVDHLVAQWYSTELDLGVSVCPSTKQEWVLVPGFAVRSPAEDSSPAGLGGTPTSVATAGRDDTVKTGQYL